MRALALAAALAAGLALPAGAACRQALVLALDVSGSVDEVEYTLQLGGLAEALGTPEVRGALLAMPEAPVALAIFEWSSAAYQRDILGWTLIEGPETLEAVRARLLAWRRETAPEATGIGAAMRHAAGLLAAAPACWKRTLDISGDGKNNDWPAPEAVHRAGTLAGVTVNGLVIGQEDLVIGDTRNLGVGELGAYYHARVIGGPDAFVEVALGFSDYAAAMTRKLLRELSVPTLGQAPARPPARLAAR